MGRTKKPSAIPNSGNGSSRSRNPSGNSVSSAISEVSAGSNPFLSHRNSLREITNTSNRNQQDSGNQNGVDPEFLRLGYRVDNGSFIFEKETFAEIMNKMDFERSRKKYEDFIRDGKHSVNKNDLYVNGKIGLSIDRDGHAGHLTAKEFRLSRNKATYVATLKYIIETQKFYAMKRAEGSEDGSLYSRFPPLDEYLQESNGRFATGVRTKSNTENSKRKR